VFMATETADWTRDELERFPCDGNRYEVLDGELLVTPQASMDHQGMCARVFGALYNYCELHRIGGAFSPASVRWGKNELQPDVEAVLGYRPGTGLTWETAQRPSIVVEILSPSGVARTRDLSVKKDAYLLLGVETYWVIDLDARHVHVWSGGRPEEIVSGVLRWHPNPAIAPFEVTVEQLFRP
jgi:Uma2 family endonuclease